MESYFYQALMQVVGARPPKFMLAATVDDYLKMDDEHSDKLQEWAVNNVKAEWMTGIGAIEAAMTVVREAVSNGNITESEHNPDQFCINGDEHQLAHFGSQNERRCNKCSWTESYITHKEQP